MDIRNQTCLSLKQFERKLEKQKGIVDQIVLIKSNQTPWAFTIKKTGINLNKVTIETYSSIVKRFNESGFIKDIEEEYDSKQVLHLHGIVLLRKGFMRKMLCMPGFHVKLEEIYDELGWIKYINKNKL